MKNLIILGMCFFYTSFAFSEELNRKVDKNLKELIFTAREIKTQFRKDNARLERLIRITTGAKSSLENELIKLKESNPGLLDLPEILKKQKEQASSAITKKMRGAFAINPWKKILSDSDSYDSALKAANETQRASNVLSNLIDEELLKKVEDLEITILKRERQLEVLKNRKNENFNIIDSIKKVEDSALRQELMKTWNVMKKRDVEHERINQKRNANVRARIPQYRREIARRIKIEQETQLQRRRQQNMNRIMSAARNGFGTPGSGNASGGANGGSGVGYFNFSNNGVLLTSTIDSGRGCFALQLCKELDLRVDFGN